MARDSLYNEQIAWTGGPKVLTVPRIFKVVAIVSATMAAVALAFSIVVATGLVAVVAGTVLILARPTIPGNCDADGGTCAKLASETDAQAADDRDRAGRYVGFGRAGVLMIIAGGTVAAAGLVWYFLERPPRRAAMIVPWVATGSGGIAAQGTF